MGFQEELYLRANEVGNNPIMNSPASYLSIKESNRLPVPYNGFPMAKYALPMTHDEYPMAHDALPITHGEHLTAHDALPITHDEHPTAT